MRGENKKPDEIHSRRERINYSIRLPSVDLNSPSIGVFFIPRLSSLSHSIRQNQ